MSSLRAPASNRKLSDASNGSSVIVGVIVRPLNTAAAFSRTLNTIEAMSS